MYKFQLGCTNQYFNHCCSGKSIGIGRIGETKKKGIYMHYSNAINQCQKIATFVKSTKALTKTQVLTTIDALSGELIGR